jgi:6-phosphogluconolactonase
MSDDRRLLFIGTYTRDNGSKGIYTCRQDAANGALEVVGNAPFVDSPSFLAIHPSKRYLYACNSLPEFRGKPGGAVSAFALDPGTGAMELLNQESTIGVGPCHVNVDRAGKLAMATNYGGGSICALPILPDGRLAPASDFHQFTGASVHPRRQTQPHAHSIWPDPTNQYAFTCDLGTDKVRIFQMDLANGKLVPGRQAFARTLAGVGPRHLEFHPNGRWMYVVNEVASSVTLFDWDAARGTLTEVQHLDAVPEGVEGNTAADIHLTPDGKWLYATNRGHETIAMFAVDGATGLLTFLGYQSCLGKHPRNFAIDPAGAFLYAANMQSNDIFAFRINGTSGQLEPTGFRLDLPAPVCLKFLA